MLGLVGPDHEYVAYCLDQAVGMFGRHVDAELEEIDETKPEARKRASKRILAKYMDLGEQGSGYADPALMMK